MTTTCPDCGEILKVEGEQANAIRGTMTILGTCTNSGCKNHLSTFGHSERPMATDELARFAALRERLGIS
jgi:hypothetical protein